jgi:hypothetical protein
MSFDQYCSEDSKKEFNGDYVIRINDKWGVVELGIEDIPFLTERLNALDTNNPQVVKHLKDYNNPHNVTAKQVGLEHVDNTSDKDKPISDKTLEKFEEFENKQLKFKTEDGELSAKLGDTVPISGGSNLDSSVKNSELVLTLNTNLTGLMSIQTEKMVVSQSLEVPDGAINKDSKDAVNGSQLTTIKTDILELENQINSTFSFDENTGEFYINFKNSEGKYFEFTFGPGYYGLTEK